MKRSTDFARRWPLGLLVLSIAAVPATAVAADAWNITLGGGAYTHLEYPGSDSNEVRPLPIVDIVYANRWFLRNADGLGVYVWRDQHWAMSMSVGPDFLRRREKDDARLRGLGNVSETARAIFGTAYRAGRFETRFTLSSDVGGQGHGTAADFQFQLSQPINPRVLLYVGAGGAWTNTKFARTFFGVNDVQHARSGFAEFSPSSGVTSARVFLASTYNFRLRWSVGAQASLGRWFGDAADSPITERTRFCSLSAYLAYTF